MSTDVALKAAEKTTEFDTTFSNTVIAQAGAEEMEDAAEEKQEEEGAAAGTVTGQRTDIGIAAAAGFGMLLAAAVIAGTVMGQTLKKETLQMLGDLEE